MVMSKFVNINKSIPKFAFQLFNPFAKEENVEKLSSFFQTKIKLCCKTSKSYFRYVIHHFKFILTLILVRLICMQQFGITIEEIFSSFSLTSEFVNNIF